MPKGGDHIHFSLTWRKTAAFYTHAQVAVISSFTRAQALLTRADVVLLSPPSSIFSYTLLHFASILPQLEVDFGCAQQAEEETTNF